MEEVLAVINDFFKGIKPVSDYLWAFPTQNDWYSSVPVIGQISFLIILLVGLGLYVSVITRFVQLRQFKKGVKILMKKKSIETGISPLSSFLLSAAMRIGGANIIAVTGAIIVGGPGAMFWMWVSAFFGMATSYIEGTLAQMFKTKKGDEFVGGMPFYGKQIIGRWKKPVTYFLAAALLAYSLFSLPSTVYHMFPSIEGMVSAITNVDYPDQSAFNYGIAIGVILVTAVITFGGIKRISRITNAMVPAMSLFYMAIVLILSVCNIDQFPYYIKAVFVGAFKPEAVFGAVFGQVVANGVKRGLMSNDAGKGIVSMLASTADNDHPCDQGAVQSIGVFLDTMIICTLTGFVLVLAHLWTTPEIWSTVDTVGIHAFIESVNYLTPGTALDAVTRFSVFLCYALFTFTTIFGMLALCDVVANMVSDNKKFLTFIRVLGCVIFVPVGALTVPAGLNLSNLWNMGDMLNAFILLINVPILFMGCKVFKKALKHYESDKWTKQHLCITSEDVGIEMEYWDIKAKNLGQKVNAGEEEKTS